ncbi:MAG: SprB repeat-containing protein [Bacteroidetes bacterium]|nr:SprB repeat-containing protein [Bacteroidota bacterium]
MSVTIGTVTNTTCNGANTGAIAINVSGGTQPYTFVWSNGATTQDITNLSALTYTVTVTDSNGCTATLSQLITQPGTLSVIIGTVTNTTATEQAQGNCNKCKWRHTTIHFVWSNGATTQDITNLSALTYTVTVTDSSGCTATLSQLITQPGTLSVTIGTVTNTTCNGANTGAIAINVSGGTQPYAFAWSNGATTQDITNLSALTYTVAVTDSSGCTATLSPSPEH